MPTNDDIDYANRLLNVLVDKYNKYACDEKKIKTFKKKIEELYNLLQHKHRNFFASKGHIALLNLVKDNAYYSQPLLDAYIALISNGLLINEQSILDSKIWGCLTQHYSSSRMLTGILIKLKINNSLDYEMLSQFSTSRLRNFDQNIDTFITLYQVKDWLSPNDYQSALSNLQHQKTPYFALSAIEVAKYRLQATKSNSLASKPPVELKQSTMKSGQAIDLAKLHTPQPKFSNKANNREFIKKQLIREFVLNITDENLKSEIATKVDIFHDLLEQFYPEFINTKGYFLIFQDLVRLKNEIPLVLDACILWAKQSLLLDENHNLNKKNWFVLMQKHTQATEISELLVRLRDAGLLTDNMRTSILHHPYWQKALDLYIRLSEVKSILTQTDYQKAISDLNLIYSSFSNVEAIVCEAESRLRGETLAVCFSAEEPHSPIPIDMLAPIQACQNAPLQDESCSFAPELMRIQDFDRSIKEENEDIVNFNTEFAPKILPLSPNSLRFFDYEMNQIEEKKELPLIKQTIEISTEFTKSQEESKPEKNPKRKKLSPDEIKEMQNLQIQSLFDEAKAVGYECENMPLDGSCFFHAIADQLKTLGLSPIKYHDLRLMAVKYIQDNFSVYKDSIPKRERKNFLRVNRLKKTWADHYLIQALSIVLKMKFIIIRNNGSVSAIYPLDMTPEATLHLGLLEDYHYLSLRKRPDWTPTKIIAEKIFNEKRKRNEEEKTDSSLQTTNKRINTGLLNTTSTLFSQQNSLHKNKGAWLENNNDVTAIDSKSKKHVNF